MIVLARRLELRAAIMFGPTSSPLVSALGPDETLGHGHPAFEGDEG